MGASSKAACLRPSPDAVDHLADRLALDRQAGGRRIGNADPRPEQAHVVVDLGDRADGGAGLRLVVFCSMEIAGDRPSIRSTSGLLHQLQELAGVGGQAFDIAALALGIDGVEREARLAGARQAGDHHELVARKINITFCRLCSRAPRTEIVFRLDG